MASEAILPEIKTEVSGLKKMLFKYTLKIT